MKRCALLLFLALTWIVLGQPAIAADAAGDDANVRVDQVLPATTVLYAELSQPKQLIATLLDHPIRKDIEQRKEVQQAFKTQDFKIFLAVVGLLENQIGKDWRTVIEAITAHGLCIAVDAETEGVVILAKSADADILKKTRDAIVELARKDAENKGKSDPFRTVDYRGVTAHRAGDARFAVVDQWFVMTNKDDLGKKVIDNLLDVAEGKSIENSLSADRQFQDARAATRGEPSGWGYVNLAFLRNAGVAKKLFSGKAENPGAELLVGGILDTIVKTPYATAALDIRTKRLGLSFAVPHNSEWTSEARGYFFGPDSKGAAPPLLRPRNMLLSIGTYRNLPAMWAAADDLYDENASAKLAQADSNLSTLFSGRDFGNEVLGSLGPEIRLVVTQQDFKDADQPVPDIKLPAVATVLQLNNKKIARQLNVSFQSVIGLVNFGQSQQGLPQFELSNESLGDGKLVSAVYLPEDPDEDAKDNDAAPSVRKGIIQYNLSPSLAFVNDQLIISSSKSLAKQLLQMATAGAEATKGDAKAVANTYAFANVQAVRNVLADNRNHLVAQNMLEKGHSKGEAEREIDTFLDLLGYLKDASLQLMAESDRLELKMDVNLKTP